MARIQLPLVGVKPSATLLDENEPVVTAAAPFVLVGGPASARRRDAARELASVLGGLCSVHEGNASDPSPLLFVLVAQDRVRDPALRRLEAKADLVVSFLDASLASQIGKCLDAAFANHVGS